MISKHIEKLVVKITTDFAAGRSWHPPKDPEQWLIALLLAIEEGINEPSTMLWSPLQQAFFTCRKAQKEQLLRKQIRKQKGVGVSGKRKGKKQTGS